MAVTNLQVVCKIIMCVSAFTEVAIIFLEIHVVKAAAGRRVGTLRCRLREGCHRGMGACHRTSDGQEHKIIWLAGSEQDTIFT